MTNDAVVDALWHERPRDWFVRGSLAVIGSLMLVSWFVGNFDWLDLVSERRQANLNRFLEEMRPFPLQGVEWDWGVALAWGTEAWTLHGAEAVWATLWFSILAIGLAAVASIPLALPAARNFARAEPFAVETGRAKRVHRVAWASVRLLSRGLLVGMRSIPEYLAAFLLLAILGPTPITAVLALAIHNTGILGRLGAETVENIPSPAPASLRAVGGRRSQLAVWVLLPELLPRLLLYFFYRWETCVRESTVLGLLGIVSLGFWIDDARTRGHTDVLIFYVGLGVGIVIVGDLISSVAREWLRRVG